MTTKVGIINRALRLIGANNITSLGDGTLEANAASTMYEDSLRSILSECLWGFATKRVLLSQITTTPDWSTNSMNTYFQLPADVVRIFGVSNENADWSVEGNLILANVSELGILYTYYLDEPQRYSASFIEAFAYRLAADLCYDLTNSNNFAQQLLQVYESQYLPKARTQNSQTGTHTPPKDDEWINSRYWGVAG